MEGNVTLVCFITKLIYACIWRSDMAFNPHVLILSTEFYSDVIVHAIILRSWKCAFRSWVCSIYIFSKYVLSCFSRLIGFDIFYFSYKYVVKHTTDTTLYKVTNILSRQLFKIRVKYFNYFCVLCREKIFFTISRF